MEDKKKMRCTNRQKDALVEYMAGHNFFANGEFTGPLGQIKSRNEWEKLKLLLDQLGPAKPVIAWQRTWRDLKKKARNENAVFRRQSNSTGNFMEIIPVSSTSKKVLGVIGDATSVGIGPEESPIGHVGASISSQVTPSTSSQVAPSTSSQVAPSTSSQVAPSTSSQVAPSTSSQVAPSTSSQVAPDLIVIDDTCDRQSCDSPPAHDVSRAGVLADGVPASNSNTTGFRRARARFIPPASIFENLHKQTNSLLQVLIKEVRSNNMLKAEQNALFKEQNNILREKRTSQHDKENEPEEVTTNNSNSTAMPAESFKFAMTASKEQPNQPQMTVRIGKKPVKITKLTKEQLKSMVVINKDGTDTVKLSTHKNM